MDSSLHRRRCHLDRQHAGGDYFGWLGGSDLVYRHCLSLLIKNCAWILVLWRLTKRWREHLTNSKPRGGFINAFLLSRRRSPPHTRQTEIESTRLGVCLFASSRVEETPSLFKQDNTTSHRQFKPSGIAVKGTQMLHCHKHVQSVHSGHVHHIDQM